MIFLALIITASGPAQFAPSYTLMPTMEACQAARPSVMIDVAKRISAADTGQHFKVETDCVKLEPIR